jgi:hypothetical protein
MRVKAVLPLVATVMVVMLTRDRAAVVKVLVLPHPDQFWILALVSYSMVFSAAVVFTAFAVEHGATVSKVRS